VTDDEDETFYLRPGARAVFIDDGGESTSVTMLCAVCIDAAVVDGVRGRLDELRVQLAEFLPAFALEHEFHAIRLARRVTPTERRRAGRLQLSLLRDHERAFIYQHALHALGSLPGHPTIYTAAMKVPGGRIPGEPRGSDVVRVTRGLMGWIVEHEPVITEAVIDRGDQFRHNLTGYREIAGASAALLTSLHGVESSTEVLLQMADLACYAAHKAIAGDANPQGRAPGLQGWYREALSELWAAGAGEDGVRHLRRE
jgi:hypothetical protein